jgi:hypothetical protein
MGHWESAQLYRRCQTFLSKMSSGIDPHYATEFLHHSIRCLRSGARSECLSPLFKSRWRPEGKNLCHQHNIADERYDLIVGRFVENALAYIYRPTMLPQRPI